MKIVREFQLDSANQLDGAILSSFKLCFDLLRPVSAGLARNDGLGAWMGVLTRTGRFDDDFVVAMKDLGQEARKASAQAAARGELERAGQLGDAATAIAKTIDMVASATAAQVQMAA